MLRLTGIALGMLVAFILGCGAFLLDKTHRQPANHNPHTTNSMDR